MTRLKQAWLALCGKLEVREVPSAPANVSDVTLYSIDCEGWGISLMFRDGKQDLYQACYPTCDAAFSAIDGACYFRVKAIDAVKVGDRFFRRESELSIQPKPKIAKGKRRNGE